MISNFFNFHLESKSHSQYSIVISKNLGDFLFEISNNINDKEVIDFINAIMYQEFSNFNFQFSFLDMTEKNDMVSFIQSNRVDQIYKDSLSEMPFENWINDDESKNLIWNSSLRSEAKVGKLFKKITKEYNFSDSILERFVNIYKSHYDFKFNLNGRFEIISGKDIKRFYLESSYDNGGGQLGNSCMRYKFCQNFFDIYCDNPEVCNLLILYSSPNRKKISGRSLIWNCMDGSIYMDRVYSNKDSDINLFYRYASSKEWDIKWKYDRKVKIKNWKYEVYPYMDTFHILDQENGILYSDEKIWTYAVGDDNIKMIYIKKTNGEFVRSNNAIRVNGEWTNKQN